MKAHSTLHTIFYKFLRFLGDFRVKHYTTLIAFFAFFPHSVLNPLKKICVSLNKATLRARDFPVHSRASLQHAPFSLSLFGLVGQLDQSAFSLSKRTRSCLKELQINYPICLKQFLKSLVDLSHVCFSDFC